MQQNYQPHSNLTKNSTANEMVNDQITTNNFRGILNFVPNEKSQPPTSKSQNHQQKKQTPRKTINKWLFILYCNTFFLLGFNLLFLVFFNISLQQLKSVLFSIQSLFASIICAMVIYQVSPSFKEAYRLLMLPDDILLNATITSIAFTHQIFILDYNDTWYLKIYIPFYFLQIIFIVTSIKCALLHLKWTKTQVIVMKLVFIFLAVTFFTFGVYYILTRESFVQINDPIVIETMNGFQILYSFTAFNHFLQIYKKFSIFDGTDHLRYDYVFINLHSEKENTIRKQKFIRQKRQSSNSLLKLNNLNLKKDWISDFRKPNFFQQKQLREENEVYLEKDKIDEIRQRKQKKDEQIHSNSLEEKQQGQIQVRNCPMNKDPSKPDRGYTIIETFSGIKSFRLKF